jgi:hypothetical protein
MRRQALKDPITFKVQATGTIVDVGMTTRKTKKTTHYYPRRKLQNVTMEIRR